MNLSDLLPVFILSALTIILLRQTAKSSQKRKPYKGTMKVEHQGEVYDLSRVAPKWHEIQAMLKNGPSGLRSALFEADKLLDYVMQAKGFHGSTMGERLKSGGKRFSNLNDVWAAHKLRNQFAHSMDHDLVPMQVQKAVRDLGKAISELGVRI